MNYDYDGIKQRVDEFNEDRAANVARALRTLNEYGYLGSHDWTDAEAGVIPASEVGGPNEDLFNLSVFEAVAVAEKLERDVIVQAPAEASAGRDMPVSWPPSLDKIMPLLEEIAADADGAGDRTLVSHYMELAPINAETTTGDVYAFVKGQELERRARRIAPCPRCGGEAEYANGGVACPRCAWDAKRPAGAAAGAAVVMAAQVVAETGPAWRTEPPDRPGWWLSGFYANGGKWYVLTEHVTQDDVSRYAASGTAVTQAYAGPVPQLPLSVYAKLVGETQEDA